MAQAQDQDSAPVAIADAGHRGVGSRRSQYDPRNGANCARRWKCHGRNPL